MICWFGQCLQPEALRAPLLPRTKPCRTREHIHQWWSTWGAPAMNCACFHIISPGLCEPKLWDSHPHPSSVLALHWSLKNAHLCRYQSSATFPELKQTFNIWGLEAFSWAFILMRLSYLTLRESPASLECEFSEVGWQWWLGSMLSHCVQRSMSGASERFNIPISCIRLRFCRVPVCWFSFPMLALANS